MKWKIVVTIVAIITISLRPPANATDRTSPGEATGIYLEKAEEAVWLRDTSKVVTLVNEIENLRKSAEGGLELPTKFYVRYAAAALFVDSTRIARESAEGIITETGKQGELYEEAMAILTVSEIKRYKTRDSETSGDSLWEYGIQFPGWFWDSYPGPHRNDIVWCRGETLHRLVHGYARNGGLHTDAKRMLQWDGEGWYEYGKIHGYWKLSLIETPWSEDSGWGDKKWYYAAGEFVHGKKEGTWLQVNTSRTECWATEYKEGVKTERRKVHPDQCKHLKELPLMEDLRSSHP